MCTCVSVLCSFNIAHHLTEQEQEPVGGDRADTRAVHRHRHDGVRLAHVDSPAGYAAQAAATAAAHLSTKRGARARQEVHLSAPAQGRTASTPDRAAVSETRMRVCVCAAATVRTAVLCTAAWKCMYMYMYLQ